MNESLLSVEMEVGAKIIGKSVVEATKISNIISDKNPENCKELVNLIFTRCEVLKSEILAICESEVNFEQKQALMKDEQALASDYFNSILAQIS